MKKLSLAALALCALAVPTHAQTQQGDRLYSFNGSGTVLGSQNTILFNDSRTSFRQYSLGLGYQRGRFVRDNVASGWLLGLTLVGGRSKRVAQGDRWSLPVIELGYWRRYYVPGTGAVRFFAQPQLSGTYFSNSERRNDGDRQNLERGFALNAGVDVGAALFIKNGWALEARTTLGSAALTRQLRQNTTDLALSGGLGLGGFGLHVAKYFGGSAPTAPGIWGPRQTIYEPGDTFIGADIQTRLPFVTSEELNRNALGSVGISIARFKSASQARGAGLSVGYRQERTIGFGQGGVQQRNETGTLSFAVTPFREYYWPLGSSRWSVLVNAGLAIEYARQESEVSYRYPTGPASPAISSTSHTLGVRLTARPGIQYQLSPRLAVAALAGGASFGNVSAVFTRNEQSRNNGATVQLNPTPSLILNSFGLGLRYFPGRTGN
jgi:hypothetical protein